MVRRCDDEGAELVRGLGARLDGGAADNSKESNHLRGAVGELGVSEMCPRMNGAGRSFSVRSIGLSITMAMLACRPLDFEDFYMLGEKVAS